MFFLDGFGPLIMGAAHLALASIDSESSCALFFDWDNAKRILRAENLIDANGGESTMNVMDRFSLFKWELLSKLIFRMIQDSQHRFAESRIVDMSGSKLLIESTERYLKVGKTST